MYDTAQNSKVSSPYNNIELRYREQYCDHDEIEMKGECGSREPVNEIVHMATSWRRRHILHDLLLSLWIVYSRGFMWDPTTLWKRCRLSGDVETSHRLDLSLSDAGAISLHRLPYYVVRCSVLVDRFPKHRSVHVISCVNYKLVIYDLACDHALSIWHASRCKLTWRAWCSSFVHHETRRRKLPCQSLYMISYNNVLIDTNIQYSVCECIMTCESCITPFIYTHQSSNVNGI